MPISEFEASQGYIAYSRPHQSATKRDSLKQKPLPTPPHPTPGEAVAHNFNPKRPKKESNDRLGRSPRSLGRGFLPHSQNNWRFETSALSTLNPVCDEALEPGTGEMGKH